MYLSDTEKATIKKAAQHIRAINHPLRQKILDYIHSKGKSTVTDIYVTLRLEQSVASQHLAILRKAHFVNTTREGKYIYYSVNDSRISNLVERASEIIKTTIQDSN